MTDFSGFDVFSEKAAVAEADRVQLLDPELLYPDPDNVRREIDPAKIDEMAETIKERGQLQPVTIAPKDSEGRYKIQFGERRWRACQKLGIKVRAIVSKTDDPDQVRIDQFIENDQREDLSTADIIAFVAGQVAAGRSLAELARATGRNRTLLTRYHGLANAPDYIAALFGDVSMRSAVAMAQAAKKDDEATRAFVASTAIEDMTVLTCESLARDVGAKKTAPTAAPSPNSTPAIEVVGAVGLPGTTSEPVEQVPPPASTDEIRDDERDRALSETPLAAGESKKPAIKDDTPAPRSAGKPKPVKAQIERPTIEIEGKRAIVVEALLHFDGEPTPRILSWR